MASLRFPTLIAPLVFTILFHTTIGDIVQPPPPPPSLILTSCTDILVDFSRCLSYISLPPNNLSDTVPSICCDTFSSAIDSGNGMCLCYLLRDPLILGFPLNFTRIISLPSICPLSDDNSANTTGFSLESLCAGTEVLLPPLLPSSSAFDPKRNYGLSPSTSLAPDQSKENSNTTTPLDISSNSCSNIPCMPPHHLPVKSLGSAATVSQSSIFMFLLSFLGFLLIKISTTGM